jgi:hypothetical protein
MSALNTLSDFFVALTASDQLEHADTVHASKHLHTHSRTHACTHIHPCEPQVTEVGRCGGFARASPRRGDVRLCC